MNMSSEMRKHAGVAIQDITGVRDLAPEVLDEHGQLRILPASYWATTTMAERGVFGVRHGCYSFPTTELVEYLDNLIGLVDRRRVIEIGAGNGVLAKALRITATDNKQQLMPKYKLIYEASKQPIVNYGDNIELYDAKAALSRFKPDVVIGCWVTHKYERRRDFAGGNEIGVDEAALLDRVKLYVHVGNDGVHKHKAIWNREHTIIRPDWLYSRAFNGEKNAIAIWRGGKA